jgi:hypothetical protein
MTYLDVKRLQAIDPGCFRAQTPYPWVNPAGLLTDSGYDRLRETPQGHLRKVFIVVINRCSPLDRVVAFSMSRQGAMSESGVTSSTSVNSSTLRRWRLMDRGSP